MVMSPDSWCQVADLAYRLGAADILGYGLGRQAAGTAIVNRLGLPSLPLTDMRVWRKSAPRGSASLTEFWSVPTLRAKANWIRWMVIPSPAKIRYMSLPSDAPRHRLLGAYARYWRNLGRDLGPGAAAAARVVKSRQRLAAGGRDGS